MTSAAKAALPTRGCYGTAEAVPLMKPQENSYGVQRKIEPAMEAAAMTAVAILRTSRPSPRAAMAKNNEAVKTAAIGSIRVWRTIRKLVGVESRPSPAKAKKAQAPTATQP